MVVCFEAFVFRKTTQSDPLPSGFLWRGKKTGPRSASLQLAINHRFPGPGTDRDGSRVARFAFGRMAGAFPCFRSRVRSPAVDGERFLFRILNSGSDSCGGVFVPVRTAKIRKRLRYCGWTDYGIFYHYYRFRSSRCSSLSFPEPVADFRIRPENVYGLRRSLPILPIRLCPPGKSGKND